MPVITWISSKTYILSTKLCKKSHRWWNSSGLDKHAIYDMVQEPAQYWRKCVENFSHSICCKFISWSEIAFNKKINFYLVNCTKYFKCKRSTGCSDEATWICVVIDILSYQLEHISERKVKLYPHGWVYSMKLFCTEITPEMKTNAAG